MDKTEGRAGLRKILLCCTVVLILLSACAPASLKAPTGSQPTATPAPAQSSGRATSTAPSTFTPEPKPSSTPSPSATLTQTAVPVPVFDPSNIGQLSKLNSFAYTMKYQILQTGGSGERGNEFTVTVITNPWQAQIILHQMDNTAKEDYARDSTYTWNWVGDLNLRTLRTISGQSLLKPRIFGTSKIHF